MTLVVASLVSYILGALPFAHRLSRRKGIDIFTTGTGLAGASNVLKTVGKGSAVLVLVFDLAKGALAVIVSGMMGIEGTLILIPASFAVLGHWNSIFTSFKGGDGMAIGGGVAIALFGYFAIIALFIAAVVSIFAQRLPFSSLTSIVAGYIFLILSTSIWAKNELGALAISFGVVAGLIFAHAVFGHSKRNKKIRNIEESGTN
tara:strand:+ start:291 stop:899 length:609 start_codon:yes stop_codon:yes gene_type:complete